MAQLLRPDSTVAQGSWTGDYTTVDEVTPSDADYTETNKFASTHQMTLSNPAATPGAGTCTVRWRGRRRLTNKSAEVTIEIWNGTSAMVTDATETKTDPAGTFATWDTLTFSTADVTSWTDLQVRLVASPTPAVDFDVSWIEVEVPDAVAPITKTTSLGALLFGTAELTASADAGLATVGILRTASIDATLIPKPELIWDEQFENASGYDETWSEGETIGTGPILDENFSTAGIGAAPAGWGDRCLRLVTVGGEDSYVLHRGWGGGADGIPISYTRLEVIVDEESLANSEGIHFLSTRDSENEKFYQYILYQSGSGVLKIEAQIWYDGGSSNFESIEIDLDTLYRLEMKWDITNEAWEWRVNGETIASGAISGEGLNRPLDGVFIGDIAAQNDAAVTIYLDNFAVNNTEWVGGASTQTKTTSLAAALLRQKILRTASADAALQQAANLRTTDLAAVLAAHTHLTTLVDAAVAAGLTRTTDLDAALAALQTVAASADAGIAVTGIRTTDLDSLLAAHVHLTASLDGAVAVTTTRTVALDAAVAAVVAVTTSLGAAVALNTQRTSTVDAALALSGMVTNLADAVLQALQTRSTDLDAHLIAAGAVQLLTDLDAVLRAALTVATTADAVLSATGTATADLDSALSKLAVQTVVLDALVRATGVKTADLDAHLILSIAGQKQASLDAALLRAFTITADLDARIELAILAKTVQADLDVAIARLGTRSAQADAALLKSVMATADLDAAAAMHLTEQLSLSATLARYGLTGVSDIDALLLGTVAATASLDARINIATSVPATPPQDAWLRVPERNRTVRVR